jgi:adenosylcobinamide-GDP ribazoletransferase
MIPQGSSEMEFRLSRFLARHGGEFSTAVGVLTWGARRIDSPAERRRLAAAAVYFPVVGALIGVALEAGDTALRATMPPSLRAALALAALVVISRASGLRAIAGLAAAACRREPGGADRGARGTTARRAFAAIGIVGGLLLMKGVGLAMTDGFSSAALLLAPVLGRWAPVVLAHGARPIAGRAGDRLAVGHVTSREFGWASVIAFAIALGAAEVAGLGCVIVAAALSTVLRLVGYRRRGVMSAGLLMASIEIVETVTILWLAALAALLGAPNS